MKALSLLCLVFCFFTFAGAQAQTKAPAAKPAANEKKAVITFDNPTHDFGTITAGDVVTKTFTFKNTGNAPLILTNIQTTCGCTAPKYDKAPILPGKKGSVEISFNSAGKIGKQNKVITVFSNASNNETQINILTDVMPPKN